MWNLIEAALRIMGSRIVVRTRVIPRMVDYLKYDLKKRGVRNASTVSDAVGLIIIEEALQRAANLEKDGRPRYGHLNKEIEKAADQIAAAFRGEKNTDPRIRSILSFHGLL